MRLGRRTPGAASPAAPDRHPPRVTSPDGHLLQVDVADEPERGVNIVGYFRAELGIAEVARKLAAAVELAGVPYSTITYGRTASRQTHPFRERAVGARYSTNLICVNAAHLPVFAADVGTPFFSGRYSIGVWFWEIAQFPKRFQSALRLVDEVWVATEFVRDAVARQTDKPVRVAPLPISAPAVTSVQRSELGLPERFVFLFSYDFFSVFERKNPIDLVRAFTEAFRPGEGPVLVLKSINGDRFPTELDRLRTATGARDDILIRDGYVGPESRDALTTACDCYVSLHRSEGYGLTMAEAMALGKPVIATGYSGNVDFMNERNSYLVGYRLGPVPPDCEPYAVGTEWAEPDVAEAARLMRHVYEHPDEAREIGRRARDEVLRRFTLERTVEFVQEHIGAATDAASGGGTSRAENAALTELSALVARGVEPGLRADGRGTVGFARRLLYRLLFRELAHQHAINQAVFDALVELERENDRPQRKRRRG